MQPDNLQPPTNSPTQHKDKATIYAEMIYSVVVEMNGALMAQVRSINNNEALILKAIVDLQTAIRSIETASKETRARRYEEEIISLEAQMTALQKLLDEKKTSATQGSTSEKMRSLAEQAASKIIETEKRKNEIDWPSLKKDVIKILIGSLALAIFWYLLPYVGQLLQSLTP